MKKSKVISSLLGSYTIIAATSAAIVTTSCSNNDIDKQFFNVQGKDLDVTLCDTGASIYSIKYKDTYITYHPKSKQDFLNPSYYYGKILGRVAGRISDGKMNVEGKDYQLEINEKPQIKNNCLHGGTNGLSTKRFTHYIENKDNCYNVSFNYISPANEAGFPELLDVWLTYTIYKDKSQIDINITGKTSGTTPVNLTTHPYFRLSNSGNVLDHQLTVPADKMAEFDDGGKQRVIGEKSLNDTENAPWNFQNTKNIGQDIAEAKRLDPAAGGYDHIWKFTEGLDTHTITLKNPDNNLQLDVTTDANAVIMYSNCYPNNNLEMITGETDGLYNAITIEPYTFFKSDDVSPLNITPDKTFSRYISYKLS